MLALKAKYEKGRIQLIEPMPDEIKTADLSIVVVVSDTYNNQTRSSEEEFKQIGMAAFFDNNDDANVDWEEYFDLK